MKIATLTVTVVDDGGQNRILVAPVCENEDSESNRIVQELAKIVQAALGMQEKPPMMKPTEG